MGFEEYKTGLELRNIIKTIVQGVLERERPKYRYGRVWSVDPDSPTCQVILNGDMSPVEVNIGAVRPMVPGQVVRVDGMGTDKFVADVTKGPHYPRRTSPPPYMPVTFKNGFSHYADISPTHTTVGYTKTWANIVSITGTVRGTTTTINTVMFTLPEGYRPENKVSFTCAADTSGGNTGSAVVEVRPNGDVVIASTPGGPGVTGFLALGHIMFPALGAIEEWIPLTLLNGFGNADAAFGTPGWGLDALGRPWLRGVLSRSTAITTDVPMFLLPVALRPTGQPHYSVPTAGGMGFVDVQTSGMVQAKRPTTSNTYIGLNQIYLSPNASFPQDSQHRVAPPAMLNNWTRYGSGFGQPSFILFADGIVFAEGMTGGGTVAANVTTGAMCGIPRDIAPVVDIYSTGYGRYIPDQVRRTMNGKHIYATLSTEAHSRTDIELGPAGVAMLIANSGTNSWRSWHGITWLIN